MLGLQVIQVWSKLQWVLYHSAHWNVTWLQGRISKDIVWNQGWNSFPNPRWENDFVSAARENFDLVCHQGLSVRHAQVEIYFGTQAIQGGPKKWLLEFPVTREGQKWRVKRNSESHFFRSPCTYIAFGYTSTFRVYISCLSGLGSTRLVSSFGLRIEP